MSERKLGFTVVFASGEDPDYPATELNYHSTQTRGWHSPRFCEYPQEIGIAFADGVVNISQVQLLSHQHKIATKIELFCGVGDDYLTADFTRLGYLSLDDNERSNFKARELKSVYIKCRGSYLKLLFHKCHINTYNLYSQVGLIAINVLGHAVHQPRAPGLPAPVIRSDGNAGVMDLAVDMGMDSETASLLREVATRKEEAVAAEDFEAAKRLKSVQDQILQIGGSLANLHTEKARAIQIEDYDAAGKIKDEITRLRSVIIVQMLDLGVPVPPSLASAHAQIGNGSRPAQSAAFSNSSSSASFGANAASQYIDSRRVESPVRNPGSTSYDEMPVRGANRMDNTAGSANSTTYEGYENPGLAGQSQTQIAATPTLLGGSYSGSSFSPPRPASRQIRPSKFASYGEAAEEEVRGEAGGAGLARGEQLAFGSGAAPSTAPNAMQPMPHLLAGVVGAESLPAPEPFSTMTEKASGPVTEIFGEYVGRCLVSRQWALRDAAVAKIALEIEGGSWTAKTNINGLVSCVAGVVGNITAKEKVSNVFITASVRLLPALLRAIAGNRMRKHDIIAALEPLATAMLERAGDNSTKIRETAMEAILELSAAEVMGPVYIAQNLLMKRGNKKTIVNIRLLQSKLELLTILVESQHLLHLQATSPSEVASAAEAIVNYCQETGSFAHANGDIRHCTLYLCVALRRAAGAVVETLLQPLLRPKQMEEYNIAFAAAVDPEAFDNTGNTNSNLRSGASDAMNNFHPPNQSLPLVMEEQQESKGVAQPNEPEEGTCQFCGGCGPNATEKELDLHYWKECLLLSSCPACAQVIEIATLHEHLLDECDQKQGYEPCPTCGCAVKSEEMEDHRKNANCQPLPDPSVAQRCPLCFADLPPEKNGLIEHLVKRECPKNPRN